MTGNYSKWNLSGAVQACWDQIKENSRRGKFKVVLHPLVVSALTEEYPVTKIRHADRVNPRAWIEHLDS